MRWLCSFLMLVGRLAIGALFIWSAFDKIMNYEVNTGLLAARGIAMGPLFLFAACLIELAGGFSLIIGYKIRFGALLLALFLIPVTLIFHNFWDLAPEQGRDIQTKLFLNNLAIFGGLLYVLAAGGGACSSDSCCSDKCVPKS